jgi:hypothetical protein
MADLRRLMVEHYSLWLLTIAPVIWAAHLLLSYVTAATWCAKFIEPGGALGGVRTAIVWYTVLALVGIAAVGWEGFRRNRYATETTTHALDTAADRRRFLGFATFLLSGLSAVGVLYAALAASYFETCR